MSERRAGAPPPITAPDKPDTAVARLELTPPDSHQGPSSAPHFSSSNTTCKTSDCSLIPFFSRISRSTSLGSKDVDIWRQKLCLWSFSCMVEILNKVFKLAKLPAWIKLCRITNPLTGPSDVAPLLRWCFCFILQKFASNLGQMSIAFTSDWASLWTYCGMTVTYFQSCEGDLWTFVGTLQ